MKTSITFNNFKPHFSLGILIPLVIFFTDLFSGILNDFIFWGTIISVLLTLLNKFIHRNSVDQLTYFNNEITTSNDKPKFLFNLSIFALVFCCVPFVGIYLPLEVIGMIFSQYNNNDFSHKKPALLLSILALTISIFLHIKFTT